MRSQRELQERVDYLQKLEDEEAKHIIELMNDDSLHLLDIAIMRANTIQNEKLTLQWVLDENMECSW